MAASRKVSDATDNPGLKPTGTQTLARGLDVIEAVADGLPELADIAARVGLTKSTTYRLAAALVERRYLDFMPRSGYRLGPKLLELGHETHRQLDLVQVARPHLLSLSAKTLDTVHLGILDEGRALYLDKIPGRRRVEIGSRVGERQPLWSTGLGKALILDLSETERAALLDDGVSPEIVAAWQTRMQTYAAAGYAFDLEENEDRIRCVAAPIRDASGSIAGAISLSSARQYMDDERMETLSAEVRGIAEAISRELGWNPDRYLQPEGAD